MMLCLPATFLIQDDGTVWGYIQVLHERNRVFRVELRHRDGPTFVPFCTISTLGDQVIFSINQEGAPRAVDRTTVATAIRDNRKVFAIGEQAEAVADRTAESPEGNDSAVRTTEVGEDTRPADPPTSTPPRD